MQIFNGNIEHTQGESFTLDREVAYPNGDPYIISSQVNNPYILFTIASSQYEQKDRYIMRHWLDTTNEDGTLKFPRFYQTIPNEELFEDLTIHDANTFFNWLNSQGSEVWDAETGLTKEVYKLNNGTYWYGKGLFEGEVLTELTEVLIYNLRLIIPFSHEETQNMTGQKYVYFIEGINGVELNSWLLQAVYDSKTAIEKLFTTIKIYENLNVITVTDSKNGFPEDVSGDNPLLYSLLVGVKYPRIELITLDQPIVITEDSYNDIIINNGSWKVITNINGRGLNKWETL